MGDFLTSASLLTCPHGGRVTITPAAPRVAFGGDDAVLASDPVVVGGCPFPVVGPPNPCVTVQWWVTATRSVSGGAATLTSDSIGLCVAANSAPQGIVVVQVTQTRAGGL